MRLQNKTTISTGAALSSTLLAPPMETLVVGEAAGLHQVPRKVDIVLRIAQGIKGLNMSELLAKYGVQISGSLGVPNVGRFCNV